MLKLVLLFWLFKFKVSFLKATLQVENQKKIRILFTIMGNLSISLLSFQVGIM